MPEIKDSLRRGGGHHRNRKGYTRARQIRKLAETYDATITVAREGPSRRHVDHGAHDAGGRTRRHAALTARPAGPEAYGPSSLVEGLWSASTPDRKRGRRR